jgi:hypothetical protein
LESFRFRLAASFCFVVKAARLLPSASLRFWLKSSFSVSVRSARFCFFSLDTDQRASASSEGEALVGGFAALLIFLSAAAFFSSGLRLSTKGGERPTPCLLTPQRGFVKQLFR